MLTSRTAAAFVVFAIFFSASYSYSSAAGTQADAMCPPVTPNEEEYRPDKPWAKTFKEIQNGKEVQIYNLYGTTCFDKTNNELTTGHCVEFNKCFATKTDGAEPDQLTPQEYCKENPAVCAGGGEQTDTPPGGSPFPNVDPQGEQTASPFPDPVEGQGAVIPGGTLNPPQTNPFGQYLWESRNSGVREVGPTAENTAQSYLSPTSGFDDPGQNGIGNTFGVPQHLFSPQSWTSPPSIAEQAYLDTAFGPSESATGFSGAPPDDSVFGPPPEISAQSSACDSWWCTVQSTFQRIGSAIYGEFNGEAIAGQREINRWSATYGSVFADPENAQQVAALTDQMIRFESQYNAGVCNGSACGPAQYINGDQYRRDFDSMLANARERAAEGNLAARDLVNYIERNGVRSDFRTDERVVTAMVANKYSENLDRFQGIAERNNISVQAVAQMEHFGAGYMSRLENNPNATLPESLRASLAGPNAVSVCRDGCTAAEAARFVGQQYETRAPYADSSSRVSAYSAFAQEAPADFDSGYQLPLAYQQSDAVADTWDTTGETAPVGFVERGPDLSDPSRGEPIASGIIERGPDLIDLSQGEPIVSGVVERGALDDLSPGESAPTGVVERGPDLDDPVAVQYMRNATNDIREWVRNVVLDPRESGDTSVFDAEDASIGSAMQTNAETLHTSAPSGADDLPSGEQITQDIRDTIARDEARQIDDFIATYSRANELPRAVDDNWMFPESPDRAAIDEAALRDFLVDNRLRALTPAPEALASGEQVTNDIIDVLEREPLGDITPVSYETDDPNTSTLFNSLPDGDASRSGEEITRDIRETVAREENAAIDEYIASRSRGAFDPGVFERNSPAIDEQRLQDYLADARLRELLPPDTSKTGEQITEEFRRSVTADIDRMVGEPLAPRTSAQITEDIRQANITQGIHTMNLSRDVAGLFQPYEPYIDSIKPAIAAARENGSDVVSFTREELDGIRWDLMNGNQRTQLENMMREVGYTRPPDDTPYRQAGLEDLVNMRQLNQNRLDAQREIALNNIRNAPNDTPVSLANDDAQGWSEYQSNRTWGDGPVPVPRPNPLRVADIGSSDRTAAGETRSDQRVVAAPVQPSPAPTQSRSTFSQISSRALSSSISFFSGLMGPLMNMFRQNDQQPRPNVTPQPNTVTQPVPPIAVAVSVRPNPVARGASTTISWATISANTCTAFDSSGRQKATGAPNGSFVVAVAATSTYHVSCTSTKGQSASSSATVFVK